MRDRPRDGPGRCREEAAPRYLGGDLVRSTSWERVFGKDGVVEQGEGSGVDVDSRFAPDKVQAGTFSHNNISLYGILPV